jgi:hypothetical protein
MVATYALSPVLVMPNEVEPFGSTDTSHVPETRVAVAL